MSARQLGLSASELRQRLVDIDCQRAEVHAQIEGLRSELERLATERKALTLNIFLYYVAEGQDPLILAHVCREWREVALAATALWTKVSVGKATKSSPDVEKLLHRRFDWAGDRPVSVETARGGNACSDPHIFSIISSHAHQIGALDIDLPLPPRAACTLDGMTGRLPNLVSLRLTSSADNVTATFLRDAPALRELIISTTQARASIVDLPFDRVTTLRFDKPSQYAVRLMAKMPLLQTAELIQDSVGVMPPPRNITLKNLRILRFRHEASNLRFSWLGSLTCPALQVVALDLHAAVNPDCVQNLARFLDGCNNLISLELTTLTGNMAAGIIAHTPTILSLTLHDLTDAHPLFEALGQRHLDAPDLLPNLVQLHISAASAPTNSFSGVLELLRFRGMAGGALQKFAFTVVEHPAARPTQAFWREIKNLECEVEIRGGEVGGKDKLEILPLYSLVDISEDQIK
uniref:F-box domain-containing protein n=1 Tax=Mycena chlorophos TaxID=658473 RepID=A0ABQ0L8C6_MYCCL|nr:predicted protein [Mycena chlorophos]